MQKRYIGLLIVILILVLFVFVSGFIASVSKVNMINNTYSGDGVSFNIPENWQVSKVVDGLNTNIDIDKDNSNNTQITIGIIPNLNLSNEDLINDIQYPQNPIGWQIISSSTLTVDGNTAYENTYIVNYPERFNETMKEQQISFIKNKNTYKLIFTAPAQDFDQEKPNFDITLNSFKVL
jgi:hypothetical protein